MGPSLRRSCLRDRRRLPPRRQLRRRRLLSCRRSLRFSPLALLEALKRGHSGVRSTEAAPWSTSGGALISCWAVTTATSPLLAAILFAFHIGKVKRLTVLTRRTSFEYVILQFAPGNSGLARRANAHT